MNNLDFGADRSARMYFQFFQSIFDAADMTSSFWQPLLKGAGRSQLELASLAARQGQAVVRWQRAVTQQSTPMGVWEANAKLWQDMLDEYTSFAPRMISAVAQASRALPTFESEQAPPCKPRDRIVIQDIGDEDGAQLERLVA